MLDCGGYLVMHRGLAEDFGCMLAVIAQMSTPRGTAMVQTARFEEKFEPTVFVSGLVTRTA